MLTHGLEIARSEAKGHVGHVIRIREAKGRSGVHGAKKCKLFFLCVIDRYSLCLGGL